MVGARRGRLPGLRRVPGAHRPGDPGLRRRAGELTGRGPAVRTVVVTGGSDGIGAAAAWRLHSAGHRVVVVGRSPEKTAAVVARLPGAQGLTADFTRLDDVRALAERLAELPHIDVLAANAGASFGRRGLTVDGFERTFQVNHLAPYLLTRLLERPLREARGRVVGTASSAHWMGGVRRGRLAAAAEGGGRYVATRVYARTKWANVVLTRELARRWGPEVTATSFDPGAVATSFAQESGGLLGLAFRSPLTAFLRTPAQGADTLFWLATADDGWRTGGHHADRAPARSLPSTRDEVRGRELWELSARLVGLPG